MHFYTFIFDIEYWRKYTPRQMHARMEHNDDPRMFVLYSAFPRSKDDVLVVITQDESACRARELCTVPFSFQRCIMRTFYRGLLCFFHLSSVRFMIHRRGYKDIFFDISIRRMEHVHTRVCWKNIVRVNVLFRN